VGVELNGEYGYPRRGMGDSDTIDRCTRLSGVSPKRVRRDGSSVLAPAFFAAPV
jgi:hypothetical protein